MSDLDLIYGTKPKETPPPVEEDAPADRPRRKQGGANARKNVRKDTKPPSAATSPKASNTRDTRPIDQSINPPVNRLINQPIDTSHVIAKPKGFYITHKQDKELDEAVRKLSKKLEGKAMIKIDRSTILRLVLEEADLTAEATIKRLTNQLINRLINQLTNK
jgi:hypothetical protein